MRNDLERNPQGKAILDKAREIARELALKRLSEATINLLKRIPGLGKAPEDNR